MNIEKAIKDYQCAGCIHGSDPKTCSKFITNSTMGEGCIEHFASTTLYPIGKIFLGLPKGFNRLGSIDAKEFRPNIYSSFESSPWTYDNLNVPVWKYLTKDSHTIVKGICPRINLPFIHIFLEDCIAKIDCIEITEDFLESID